MVNEARSSKVKIISVNEETGWAVVITQREIVILQALADGYSTIEAGKIAIISHNTARKDMKKIFQKLEVTNRTHAVAKAFRAGIIE